MFANRRGMLVSLLAMFVSRFSVILRLFVLAKIMMKGSLMMMTPPHGDARPRCGL
jgi:hypothetical protein